MKNLIGISIAILATHPLTVFGDSQGNQSYPGLTFNQVEVQGGINVDKIGALIVLRGRIAQTMFNLIGKNTSYESCNTSTRLATTVFRKTSNGALWCKGDVAGNSYECQYSHSLKTGKLIKPNPRICVFDKVVESEALKASLNNGSFADPAPASKEAAAVHLFLEGKQAEKIFKNIGPDQRPNPTIHPPESLPLDHKIRQRGEDYIFCRAYREGTYTCNLAIDLLKGKAKFAIDS